LAAIDEALGAVDGVMQFAPQRNYGSLDDLKTFIDTAHGCGMMVLLDVVYNRGAIP